jgi:hypothetical protein
MLARNSDLCWLATSIWRLLGDLLVAGLEFLEQPDVLNRNDGLIREGLDQLDLRVGEGPLLPARDGNGADRRTVTEHRYAEESAIPERDRHAA